MPDFLLELLSEEIPARMQAKAQQDLARLFSEQISAAGLAAEKIETYATPRRLALIARALPAETEATREETKGPRASAPPQALDGFLRKTGLAREQLEERDGVLFAVVDKPGRSTASVLAEAVPALVRAFPWPKSMRWGEASVSTESLRWVRPLQGIVAILGEEIVDFEIAGVRSGAATVGHRFHHPGVITIGGAGDYVEKLQACHVIVDPEVRKTMIAAGIFTVANDAGLGAIQDPSLIDENAGLTEWPVPLLGRFDSSFLEVPPEVIQLTMKTNQKYFACTNRHGNLAPAFICTANIEAADGGAAIVQGNERVLSARLSDAKFFWEQDLRVTLEDQAAKLGEIRFHEKLGTMADKVERVRELALWLVDAEIVRPREDTPQAKTELYNHVRNAASLAKADLVTGLVGEFPELQGVIGGHLARAQGMDPAVVDAIRDHYKPLGQGDEVPTAPTTAAVSLADKLDTIVGFFAIGEQPTGSRDPFALRRAALGVIALLSQQGIRLKLRAAIETILSQYTKPWLNQLWASLPVDLATVTRLRTAAGTSPHDPIFMVYPAGNVRLSLGAERVDLSGAALDAYWQIQKFIPFGGYPPPAVAPLLDFFADRLKVQQREAGVRHDLIDAVFALGGEDDLVRLLARVKALQAFVETPEGADLLSGYKRAANILRKEGWATPSPSRGEGQRSEATQGEGTTSPSPSAAGAAFPSPLQGEGENGNKPLSYMPEVEETALIAALDSAEPKARAAVEAEDFEGAMAALASLRGPVDAFFDKVTVNDPDPAKREARLALLARMRDAVHRVADFSRIEG
jgi:glycyl-tRNA synthetase beta chain